MVFHLCLPLHPTNKLLLVSVSGIYIINTETGAILASSVSGAFESLSKSHIRVAAYSKSTQRIALFSDDKGLQVYEGTEYKKILSTKTLKRVMCASFSDDGSSIFAGDRAGDVYKFSTFDEKIQPLLLLGSVSILTDLVFSEDRKFMITADRDEKIRINRYPQTYEIVHFCLGHTEFISKILIIPNSPYFLSGGGDTSLFLWNFVTGELVQKISLLETGIELGDIKPDLVSLEYYQKGHTIAVMLQKYLGILFFDASDVENIKFKQLVALSIEPLRVSFDMDGNLWVVNNSTTHKVDVLSIDNEYQLNNSDSRLLKVINELELDSNSPISKVDLYEVSKMRKWSQWKPDFIAKTVAEKQVEKRLLEGDDVKPKKKRGGVKQKARKSKDIVI